jgi:hypothetical protein
MCGAEANILSGVESDEEGLSGMEWKREKQGKVPRQRSLEKMKAHACHVMKRERRWNSTKVDFG